MITIPCDYRHPQGTYCKDGQVLIYGEMGGRLPETIVCPKCQGENYIQTERSKIEEMIKDLEEERDEISEEIARLKSYLT